MPHAPARSPLPAVLGLALALGAVLPAGAPGPTPAGAAAPPTFAQAARALRLVVPAAPRGAPPFTAPLAGGGTFRSTAHRGEVVVLNFWATWCAPCREEMPALERLWQAHRGAPLLVLGVAMDGAPGHVAPFARAHRLTFPIVLDADGAVGRRFGVRSLPTTVVLDADGRQVAIALGPRAWDAPAAHDLVAALLARR